MKQIIGTIISIILSYGFGYFIGYCVGYKTKERNVQLERDVRIRDLLNSTMNLDEKEKCIEKFFDN